MAESLPVAQDAAVAAAEAIAAEAAADIAAEAVSTAEAMVLAATTAAAKAAARAKLTAKAAADIAAQAAVDIAYEAAATAEAAAEQVHQQARLCDDCARAVDEPDLGVADLDWAGTVRVAATDPAGIDSDERDAGQSRPSGIVAQPGGPQSPSSSTI